MKKLALLAGLTGLLAVGAFADSSSSGTVTISINDFLAVAFNSPNPAFVLTISDYDGSGLQNPNPVTASAGYTARANRGWITTVTTTATAPGSGTLTPSGGTSGFATNGTAGTATLSLSGVMITDGTMGSAGTVTVSIAPN